MTVLPMQPGNSAEYLIAHRPVQSTCRSGLKSMHWCDEADCQCCMHLHRKQCESNYLFDTLFSAVLHTGPSPQRTKHCCILGSMKAAGHAVLLDRRQAVCSLLTEHAGTEKDCCSSNTWTQQRTRQIQQRTQPSGFMLSMHKLSKTQELFAILYLAIQDADIQEAQYLHANCCRGCFFESSERHHAASSDP